MRPQVGDTGRNGRGGPCRVTAVAVVCLALLAVTGGGVAAAQPTPGPTPEESAPALEVPDPVPGEEVCTVTDPRLVELSGLVALDDGYAVVNDGNEILEQTGVFFLDQNCQVTERIAYESLPRDPEAMELDPESDTLWVGDTGDNTASGAEGDTRPDVALWRVDLSGDRIPVIHRFAYPDGQARDAEGLLVDGDGTPMIVTKAVGTAELFVPTDLVPNNPHENAVPLEKVGEFSPPDTGTANPLQFVGRQVITGGAVAPDGSTVVLRTYADAFEFDVTDGDVAGAITDGEPRVTPLPEEPQGEAITYSTDGSQFLTVSEVPEDAPEGSEPTILRYTPTPPPPPEPSAVAEQPAGESGDEGFSLFTSVQDILNLIAVVGVLGLLLAALGVFGIVRSRRRRAAPAEPSRTSGRAGGRGRPARDPGGEAAAPAAAPAMGRVPAQGEPAAQPGWEPGTEPDRVPAGQSAGVYTSRAATGYDDAGYPDSGYQDSGYGDPRYGDPRYGDPGHDHAGYDHAGYGREYGSAYPDAGYGTEYDAGYGGYQGDYGYPDYDPYGRYEGYESYEGYGGQYPDARQDRDYWDGTTESYRDGAHHRAEPVPDYYSDDPDYPYEFRERGRW